MEKDSNNPASKWIYILKVFAILFLLSIVISSIIGMFSGTGKAGNVALIKINGPIEMSSSSFFSESASSSEVVSLIREADENPAVKAIILDINSPGGSPVASDEIGSAIKKTNKTTVAVIREMGASGGYWIASASDHIIANRMSVTGSIGVYGSYLQLSGFLERYNITYQRLVAGEYKDIGDPFRETTAEEKKMLQDFVDELQDDFITEVAQNRNMTDSKVREIATGMFFSGKKAKELGLVDELGGIDEAKAYINRTLNITVEVAEYSEPESFMAMLSKIMSTQSFSIGQGIGHELLSYNPGIKV